MSRARSGGGAGRAIARAAALVLLVAVALQLVFAARIATWRFVFPVSTTFQRSQAWQLATRAGCGSGRWWWQQRVPGDALGEPLKRAVIAAEDSGFVEHGGIEWDAIEQARDRNARAEARAQARAQRAQRRDERRARAGLPPLPPPPAAPPRIVGGSTLTQQLAKNLFLSGERTTWRKAQEALLAYGLEALLGKDRILTLYLNEVEWGEGVFGAAAAARRYDGVEPARLSNAQAARLAIMLPAPRRFEKTPQAPGQAARLQRTLAAMPAVDLPDDG